MTTAINTPGSLGAYFLSPHMMAKADTPIIRVGMWVSPICINTPHTSLMKCSLRPMETPNNLLSWESPMMMAAALVKPTITGCDKKFTTTPNLKAPNVSCITPTINASKIANTTNCSEPVAASGANAEAVNREATATGPVASCAEEPHIAAMMPGRKAAYSP
jgi:hypothetical protein